MYRSASVYWKFWIDGLIELSVKGQLQFRYFKVILTFIDKGKYYSHQMKMMKYKVEGNNLFPIKWITYSHTKSYWLLSISINLLNANLADRFSCWWWFIINYKNQKAKLSNHYILLCFVSEQTTLLIHIHVQVHTYTYIDIYICIRGLRCL